MTLLTLSECCFGIDWWFETQACLIANWLWHFHGWWAQALLLVQSVCMETTWKQRMPDKPVRRPTKQMQEHCAHESCALQVLCHIPGLCYWANKNRCISNIHKQILSPNELLCTHDGSLAHFLPDLAGECFAWTSFSAVPASDSACL